MIELVDIVNFLKSTNVLSDIKNEEVYSKIAENLHEKKFFKLEHVYYQDENISNIYFIYGEIEIYKGAQDGKKFTIDVLRENDVFCLSAAFTGKSFTNACVKKESILYSLNTNSLNMLINKYTEFLHVLMQHMALRVASYSCAIERGILMDAFSCLASLIISLQKNNIVKASQEDLASLSGVCRETISRLLKEFKKSECLDIRKGKLIIKDFEKLKKICE